MRSASLVLVGVIMTLVMEYGLPTLGLLFYRHDFKVAYSDCATARVTGARLRPGEVSGRTYVEFRKTVLVDEFRCFDSQELYQRLRQFRVSDATISEMEVEAKMHNPEVNQ